VRVAEGVFEKRQQRPSVIVDEILRKELALAAMRVLQPVAGD
jgi:hypothetical protein